MPYIPQADHKRLLADPKSVQLPGEFNFLITHTLLNHKGDDKALGLYISNLTDYYLVNNGKSYKSYNDIIGVFMCAAFEFYRRTKDDSTATLLYQFAKTFYEIDVTSYEDKKMLENGDVFK